MSFTRRLSTARPPVASPPRDKCYYVLGVKSTGRPSSSSCTVPCPRRAASRARSVDTSSGGRTEKVSTTTRRRAARRFFHSHIDRMIENCNSLLSAAGRVVDDARSSPLPPARDRTSIIPWSSPAGPKLHECGQSQNNIQVGLHHPYLI